MTPIYRKARKHLGKDPILAPIIERHGRCTLAPKSDDPFTMLVRCVVSQQISTKAADSIYAKLLAKVKAMKPKHFAAISDDDLRSAGLSGAKQRAIRSIIAHIEADREFLKMLPTLDDEAFHATVTQIKGIGPWSADMMLMFGYGRLDVLPVGDYGVRVAAKNLYGFADLPKPAELTAIAEPWRPYRSIASWYLWRSLEMK